MCLRGAASWGLMEENPKGGDKNVPILTCLAQWIVPGTDTDTEMVLDE
jgi:hypothetical protein